MPPSGLRLSRLALRSEDDVVTARQRARLVARLVGFDNQDQTRVATAVSEIARNAVSYAGGGFIDFGVEGETAPQLLVITVTDQGRGIRDLQAVLSGQYRSATGMGIGLVGARRLMDRFDIRTGDTGTSVKMMRVFPPGSAYRGPAQLSGIGEQIEAQLRAGAAGLMEELRQQNRELVSALGQLEQRQRELTRLNAELFDTNRGVLALYAELDEKAAHLRSADELKTRFLSHMSHEFRTPLNSILALSGLLNDRVDGPLTLEQDRQVGYIRRSALELLELVNDLLDLAKVEAGKVVLKIGEFAVDELFSTLRGMLRPLLVAPTVSLVFDDASDLPPLLGDETKLAQIVRNFLSNALKFTEAGEIRVSALLIDDDSPPRVQIRVADTGIGIAPENQEKVFEEFTQVDSALQARVRGTGLGLPLCRRLAAVMKGRVWVESELGKGSSFYVEVPLHLGEQPSLDREEPAMTAPSEATDGLPLLVVEDSPADRVVVHQLLAGSPFRMLVAEGTQRARELLATQSPVAALLDVELRGEDSWRLLSDVRRDGVPCVVVSAHDEAHKAFTLGADAYGLKPLDRDWLLHTLGMVLVGPRLRDVLIIDDDARIRTILRRLLETLGAAHVREIEDGEAGWQALQTAPLPDLVLLDLLMPRRNGREVLQAIATHAAMSELPVLVCSSSEPSAADFAAMARPHTAFLTKALLDGASIADALVRLMGAEPVAVGEDRAASDRGMLA